MATVPFVQYLRPDGRRSAVAIDRPDSIAKAADMIRSHGFRFECEQLTTGEVSFTISDDDDDYAFELSGNGPDVPGAVDRLITQFDLAAALKRRARLRGASNSD